MSYLVSRWQASPISQKTGLLLALLSYCLLYPGVTQPIMSISATLSVFGMTTQLFNETRSIWETVIKLNELGYGIVALLIISFSVIIPLIKSVTILAVWLKPSQLGWKIIALMGKWSMADVFVVAILVAFFSASSTAELDSSLLVGFWWFLSFCLLSVISGLLITFSKEH